MKSAATIAISLALIITATSCAHGLQTGHVPIVGLNASRPTLLDTSSGTGNAKFSFVLPKGARQGAHGEWAVLSMHLKVSFLKRTLPDPAAPPLADITIGTRGSFAIDTLIGPTAAGGAHLESTDLLHGFQSIDFPRLDDLDLHLSNYLQNLGVAGGTNSLEVSVKSAGVIGGLQVRTLEIAPDSFVEVRKDDPSPVHMGGDRQLDVEVGKPVKVAFQVLAEDDRPRLDETKVRAVPADPFVEVITAAAIEEGVGRQRSGSAIVRVNRPGAHRLVIAARTDFNSPAWPIDIRAR